MGLKLRTKHIGMLQIFITNKLTWRNYHGYRKSTKNGCINVHKQ